MVIDLDRASEIPLGVQLVWTLRSRIASGELGPGERLPGVRELATAAGVNVNTARSVYAKLEADGLISAEHGRGTFVAEDARVDERLASVTRRALEAASEAGLDPRDLAAALFAGGTTRGAPAPAAKAPGTTRRRALRDEIAALEREIADERLAKALRDTRPAAPQPAGGRLLSEDELRAQRDELALRLAALRAPEALAGLEPEPAPASAEPSRESATRPGIVWRPVFGG